jgi:hypothetical protein
MYLQVGLCDVVCVSILSGSNCLLSLSVPSHAYFAGAATDQEVAVLAWLETASFVLTLGHNWWLITEMGTAYLRFAYVLDRPGKVFNIRDGIPIQTLTTLELMMMLVRDGRPGTQFVSLLT